MKFDTGDIVITANANNVLNPQIINEALEQYLSGDWGDLCEEDALLNEEALIHGYRLMGVYKDGYRTFWIITEWDRSYTTILLPEDY